MIQALAKPFMGDATVHQLPVVHRAVPTSPTVEVEVRAGDWASYQRAVYEFRVRVPDSAFAERKDESGMLVLRREWAIMFAQFKRERMREYLGIGRIRSFTREAKVLTPEFVQQLIADNARERAEREPYFVKIAALYAQIEQLELEIEASGRRTLS